MSRKWLWYLAFSLVGSFTANLAAAAPESAIEQKMNKIVEAAKSEGKVLVYSVLGAGSRNEMSKDFAAKYGIKVEYVVGRGNELASKLSTERNAGLYLADGISAGSGTQIITLKPAGIQERLDPLLLLPEITDPRVWIGGQIPFLDKDHTSIALASEKNTFLIRNTGMVKEGELTSFMDLLDPKWKGKLVMHDLAITGSANTWGSFMIKDVLGSKEKFRQYLKDLAKNEPFITRDPRVVVETVARGKYAVAIGSNPENVVNFLQAGSPVAVVTVREGSMITAGAGSYSVPKKAPHPNASLLFLNWLLSREGAASFSRGMGVPSSRADVQAAQAHPSFRIDPKEKLFAEVEEGVLLKDDVTKIAKEVFSVAK